MALYNEISLDDYNKLNARNQRDAAQLAAQNLAARQASLDAAQGKQKKAGLVDTLVGLATGIKDKAVDAFDTAKNVGKTVVGGINELFDAGTSDRTMKDDSQRRNDIAKQFGYNSYSEAINSGTASDDFWNAIKENNKSTQTKLKDDANIYRNNVGNVTDINLNKAKGQALNTMDTLGMALGGELDPIANIIGGGLSGLGDEYKAAAAEGRDVDWNNARTNAIAGMAGGAAGSAAGGLLGKAVANAGNPLAKALGSQLGRGIGSGAAAGAAGAGAATLANGGSLEDALTNALEGAKGGALSGGVMAGAMGLAGKGLNKIRNGRTTNIADAQPTEAQIVQKNRIEQPTAQRITEIAETPTTTTTTRQGIAIKDLDAGTESIPVRVVDGVEPVQGKGQYIDSVVRRGEANLPEAVTSNILQNNLDPRVYTDDNLAYALSLDPELNKKVTQTMVDYAKRPIEVQGGPSVAVTIPVTDRTIRSTEPTYTESTIPARNYEQQIATIPEAQVAPQIENGVATGWGNKDMTNSVKKRNLAQKIGDTLQETGQATKDSQVYAKLKGNKAEEMARKGSVQKLRELGFSPSDYDKAANLSEVVNKYYSDAVSKTKTPIEAPQLRNIAAEVADDLHISMQNRADLEKAINSMLDDAVAKDGKLSNYSMDRYTPAELEKVAKNLGIKEQNITTTNMGDSKKANRNLTPENAEYANALGEVRRRIRNEIGEMADYNEAELVARLKDAGATQKQIDYIKQGGTLRDIKRNTSILEDARTMNQQIKSDALKRGANSTNSTNFVTQVANASGASNLVNMAAKPVASLIGSVEKGIGKAISGLGNKASGNGEPGAIRNTVGNIASKAGEKLNSATQGLNDTTLSGIGFGGTTVGNVAQKLANREATKEQAQSAIDRAAIAQAQSDYDQAANEYATALANQQAAEQTLMQGANGQNATLSRIEQAMNLAMAAGDIEAYSQLADLYTQAYKINEMQNPSATTSSSAKALSANQSKALTGLQQLETLRGMQSGVRTALANSPLGGLVDLTGGDEYANQAKSLALTLGYLQSGANITPKEAENIGKAYIPSAFDSEEVRNGKLARAEQLLRDYLADTTALQQ